MPHSCFNNINRGVCGICGKQLVANYDFKVKLADEDFFRCEDCCNGRRDGDAELGKL